MSELQFLSGFCMLITAVSLAMQALMGGKVQYGWIWRPWYLRLVMGWVSAVLLCRGLDIIHTHVPPPNLIGLIVTYSFCVWQIVEISHYVAMGWSKRTATLMAASCFAAPNLSYKEADIERAKDVR